PPSRPVWGRELGLSLTSPSYGEVAQSAGGALGLDLPPAIKYLLGRVVRRPLRQQALGERRVLVQGALNPVAGDLGRHLAGLVLEPLLGELADASARFQVVSVGKHGCPELFDPLLLGGD